MRPRNANEVNGKRTGGPVSTSSSIPKEVPEEGIGFLLQRAHNLLRSDLNKVLDGSGIHLGHVAILGFLDRAEGSTQSELSARTGIEKSSMVLFLDHLESKGWLKRKPHPTDRRAHLVALTAKGIAQIGALGPRLKAVEENFVRPLSPSDREVLRNYLWMFVNR
jgi:DNA-binding MarR family transcriptional regulator